MPTEKEIEAALAAWDSIPRHKDLDGRQRMRAALEAAERVRNEADENHDHMAER